MGWNMFWAYINIKCLYICPNLPQLRGNGCMRSLIFDCNVDFWSGVAYLHRQCHDVAERGCKRFGEGEEKVK